MPVKARRAKRRTGDAATAKAWSRIFTHGGPDYLKQLHPLGIFGDDAIRAAAPAAWDAYGADYLRRCLDGSFFPRATDLHVEFLPGEKPGTIRERKGYAAIALPWALRTLGWPKGAPASLKRLWQDRVENVRAELLPEFRGSAGRV